LLSFQLSRSAAILRTEGFVTNVREAGHSTPSDESAVLSRLTPHLREPIVWTRPGSPLDLQSDMNGTVVLQAVSDLGADDQSRMLRWLGGSGNRAQTICTTTTPLFPLVVRGLFDETLYYRLNSILWRIDDSQAPTADSQGVLRAGAASAPA
jgi:hypothetical protein